MLADKAVAENNSILKLDLNYFMVCICAWEGGGLL